MRSDSPGAVVTHDVAGHVLNETVGEGGITLAVRQHETTLEVMCRAQRHLPWRSIKFEMALSTLLYVTDRV